MNLERQRQLRNYVHDSRQALLNSSLDSALAPAISLIGDEANRAIIALLGRAERRNDGIFFSGAAWASRLINSLPPGPFKRFVDPSCGVGDLLLEAARRLPLGIDLSSTLASWSRGFHGMDLHAPLAQMAWSRLQALAMHLHPVEGAKAAPAYIDHTESFRQLNSLEDSWDLMPGDCVLMNPPYNPVISPEWSTTSRGRVTAAALFLERAVATAPPGTVIAALVPEVLRSGTRFEKLRGFIEQRCQIHEFSPQGRFSSEADIDVSIISLTVRDAPLEVAPPIEIDGSGLTLAEIADVHVGSIVPHRAVPSKLRRPYLDVDGAPVWAEIYPSVQEKLSGRAFKPPFVVIRRTSGPSDKERARATIVRGSSPVIVENHLLVINPKNKTLRSCRHIMRVLRDTRTTAWLNEMLRCRHLTVKVMKKLPLWTET